eukprot:TRINITY_DN1187_c0_g1_i2.p2 TRINITY_DN1187_c0_g1~~TRINITY_DN1187_c0_g1_i2.p2  ORF type:complete len:155 (+),score=52.69 TRINITY_DN1187_c0_g1_i2:648-1112(+)
MMKKSTSLQFKKKLFSPEVDQNVSIKFQTNSGITADVECSLFSLIPKISLQVLGKGNDGAQLELNVTNWVAPHFVFNKITLKNEKNEVRVEKFNNYKSTYYYQLLAFSQAVAEGKQPLTGGADAIKNMSLIDKVYNAMGLPLRGTGAGAGAGAI